MKIFISYPPLSGKGSPMLTQNRQFQWYDSPSYIFPLVPASAATLLKNAGHEVIWNDCISERMPEDQFWKLIEKEVPEMIVMETKTPVIKQHWAIIHEIKTKYPGIRTVLMGDHVTFLPEESFRKSPVDFVLTGGDYDFSLLSLVKWLKEKGEPERGIWYRKGDSVENTGRFDLSGHDLNALPLINRQLTRAELYGEKWKKHLPFFYIAAGRDCPWGKCSFCSWTTLFPEFRLRSPENVLTEIGFLIREHQARELFDDTGTFPGGEWLKEFCKGMISRGYNREILFSCNLRADYLSRENVRLMRRAGFRKIKVGLESANPETLYRIQKGVKVEDIVEGCKTATREGLEVHLTIMVGYPWEGRREALKTIDLAGSLMQKGHIDMLQSTVVVPYPGTPLYDQARKEDLFRIDPEDYDRYDMRETALKTPEMGSEEILKLCQDIYRKFLGPRFILRNLLKVRRVADIRYLWRGFRAVKGHLKDFK